MPRQVPKSLGFQAPMSFLQVRSSSSDDDKKEAYEKEQVALGTPPMEIYGSIRVGTPAQLMSVAFDTGSNNLLLTSSACKSVGCLAHKGYVASASSTYNPMSPDEKGLGLNQQDSNAFMIDIATGEAEGEPAYDKVCLGDQAPDPFANESDLCTNMMFLQITRMTQKPWNEFPYDGVLGLGVPRKFDSSDSLSMQRYNLMSQLAETRALKKDVVSIWMSTENDTETSEIVFGEIPEERIGSEMIWLPLSAHSFATGMWELKLNDFNAGGDRLGICGSEGCRAVLDTGTAAIGASEEQVSALVTALDIKEDCSTYNDLTNLGFEFEGYTLSIGKDDYVKKIKGRCYHQFLTIDMPEPKGPAVLLGEPFFRRYLVAYDRDSLQVGISFANHNMPKGTQETSRDLALKFIERSSTVTS